MQIDDIAVLNDEKRQKRSLDSFLVVKNVRLLNFLSPAHIHMNILD